jgi:hypothetical protein
VALRPAESNASRSLQLGRVQLEFTVTDKTSVIVMTLSGNAMRRGDPLENAIYALRAPPGFCWRFVPESPLPVQFRSILRMDASAVVVWVGPDDAIDRAAKLIRRLLGAGPPIVIAIAQVHDPLTESLLRQAGALYICAHEAQQRLGDVLGSILGAPLCPSNLKTVESTLEVKMEAN